MAVHSDSWLYAVAFYYGAKLDHSERYFDLPRRAKSHCWDRMRMFKLINQYPTLFEVVTEKERGRVRAPSGTKRKKPEEAVAQSRSGLVPSHAVILF